jgi:hypothetical protein
MAWSSVNIRKVELVHAAWRPYHDRHETVGSGRVVAGLRRQ